MIPNRIRLGPHQRWHVGEPIPALDSVMEHVVKLPAEQGGHWMQRLRGRRRWLNASNDQAQVRVGNSVFNVARVIIAHTYHRGEQPPLYVNTCQFTECVNPVHWSLAQPPRPKLAKLIEARGSSIVVTHGGAPLRKDGAIAVVKHDGPVHVLRVLVNPYGQLLQILCGAPLDLEYVVVEDKADCEKCLR